MKTCLIVGFGNIGQAVLSALPDFTDFKCVGIISRDTGRTIHQVVKMGIKEKIPVYQLNSDEWKTVEADVAILCGGSKNDLPIQGPLMAQYFNTICSFDTHAHVDDYIDKNGKPQRGYYHIMNMIATQYGHTVLVCQGWDPGVLSIMRILFTACMGGAVAEAFYGLEKKGGLSMGHSDALRTIPGVRDARQYTHAKHDAIELVRSGENPELELGDSHWRECIILAEEGADRDAIEKAVITMPDYYEPFDTTVRFVDEIEFNVSFKEDMPHDGIVVCTAPHGTMEYKNVWKSNPRGTAGIILAFARATVRLSHKDDASGACTPANIPVVLLMENTAQHLSKV